ncbi:MAG TPA: DUF1573 domain-containing protein [Candidatus Didemnitutus sp.]|jgi:hypothetical protein
MLPRRLAFPAAFLASALAAHALEWDATTAESHPAPFQAEVDLEFTFRNAGSKPVHILSVNTGCHCVSAKADNEVVEPGARGRILAHFSIGDRVGLYERTIAVSTDDATQPQYLTVSVDIPDIATVTPRVLEWHRGDAPTEQFVEISAGANVLVDFKEATATNNAFEVRLEPIELGRRYRLAIKPRSTAKVANAAVRIKGLERTGHDVLVSAYANVR